MALRKQERCEGRCARRQQQIADRAAQLAPAGPGERPRQREDGGPDRASEDRHCDERPQGDARVASGQRDEAAGERHEAGEKDSPTPIAAKETIAACQGLCHAGALVSSVARPPDPVGGERADEVARGRRRDRRPEGHPAGLDGEARAHQGRLARHRDAGALRHHEQEDAKRPQISDQGCDQSLPGRSGASATGAARIAQKISVISS